MTIAQAIVELEDRGAPDVIRFLRSLDKDLAAKDATIARLQTEVDELKYGEF